MKAVIKINKFDRMRAENDEATRGILVANKQLLDISMESFRVSYIAHNAGEILTNIDREFAAKTRLDRTDIAFLFLAVALQCVRQYVFTNDKFRFESDQQSSKIMGKHIPKDLLGPVPYDAFKKSAFEGNSGISGANHRYTTLGHDPLLGWIFGPVNILSETVTKNNVLLETFDTVRECNEYKIGGYSNIIAALLSAIENVQANPELLGYAVAKHAIHLSTDAFTKMGLPIPVLNSISPKLSGKLLASGIDLYSVARGAMLSSFINLLIMTIHNLLFSPLGDLPEDLYKVKTRKILSYSNIIATSSNVIVCAITKNVKLLDVGGMLVTIYRIISDYQFIEQIKQEFLNDEFSRLIQGDSAQWEGL